VLSTPVLSALNVHDEHDAAARMNCDLAVTPVVGAANRAFAGDSQLFMTGRRHTHNDSTRGDHGMRTEPVCARVTLLNSTKRAQSVSSFSSLGLGRVNAIARRRFAIYRHLYHRAATHTNASYVSSGLQDPDACSGVLATNIACTESQR
jgi:hypothetical protein